MAKRTPAGKTGGTGGTGATGGIGKGAGAPGVFLLFGKKGRDKDALFDEYLAAENLARVKTLIGATSPISVVEYAAAEAPLADALDEVSTPPLWGGTRLVILKSAEAILAPAVGDRERLEPFVERMAQLAAATGSPGHLVLVARALAVEGTMPSSSFGSAQRLIEAVEASGGLYPCIPPYESGLKAALVRRASEEGVRLSPDAAGRLIELVGTDQMALQEELSKLLAAATGRKEITAGDVEALAASRPQATVFTLAERILDGDVKTSLDYLRQLREVTATRSSAFIIGGIQSSVRRYLTAALAVERGATASAAATALGIPRYFQDPFTGRLRRWKPRGLAALLDRALLCDVQIKTGGASEEVALETFVIDACARRFDSGELVGRWIYEVEI